MDQQNQFNTEPGGAVVTHWTRIRKVQSSKPGADLSNRGFSIIKASAVFIFHYTNRKSKKKKLF